MLSLLESYPVTVALDADADAFAGGVNTQVISMQDAHSVLFVVAIGTVNTGVGTIVLQACDDGTPTTVTDIAGRYRLGTSRDYSSLGAKTVLTTAGIATTVASDYLLLIEVTASEVEAQVPNAKGVRLEITESVNDPIDAAVIAITVPRYGAGVQDASILPA